MKTIKNQKNIDKKELYKLIVNNIKSINGKDTIITKSRENFIQSINALLSNIYISNVQEKITMYIYQNHIN
jgi:hypothetical protein